MGEFARKSWLAGWIDTEMGILADAEIAMQTGALNQSAELNLDGMTHDPLDFLPPT